MTAKAKTYFGLFLFSIFLAGLLSWGFYKEFFSSEKTEVPTDNKQEDEQTVKTEQPKHIDRQYVSISVMYLDQYPELKNTIDNNLSQLFTEFHRAYLDKDVPNLSGLYLNGKAKTKFLSLWNKHKFQALSLSLNVPSARLYTAQSEWVVFGMPISEEGNDYVTEYYIHFDSTGQIVDVEENPFPIVDVNTGNRVISADRECRLKEIVYELFKAYNEKNITFLENIYDPNGWCIVGKKVNATSVSSPGEYRIQIEEDTYRLCMQRIDSYLKKLRLVFNSGRNPKFEYANPKFYAHPNPNSRFDDVYYICLEQKFTSNDYSDHRFLTLCINIKNVSHPQICYRVWLPDDVSPEKLIGIGVM